MSFVRALCAMIALLVATSRALSPAARPPCGGCTGCARKPAYHASADDITAVLCAAYVNENTRLNEETSRVTAYRAASAGKNSTHARNDA